MLRSSCLASRMRYCYLEIVDDDTVMCEWGASDTVSDSIDAHSVVFCAPWQDLPGYIIVKKTRSQVRRQQHGVVVITVPNPYSASH